MIPVLTMSHTVRLELSSGTASTLICIPHIPMTAQKRHITTTGDFSIFQDGVRRHLGFWKFQNFNGLSGQEGQNASSCQNFVKIDRNAAEIYQFFNFSETAAVRHLGFEMRVWGPARKSIWWSLSLCKTWSESVQ